MERSTAIAIGAGVVVVGASTYLYFAHRNGWWPFKKEQAPPPPPSGGGQQPPGAPNPPGMPTVNVNVIDQNRAEADVSWSPVSGATYYKVLVNGQEVTTVQGTSTKLTNLVPGQTYQIAVAACN